MNHEILRIRLRCLAIVASCFGSSFVLFNWDSPDLLTGVFAMTSFTGGVGFLYNRPFRGVYVGFLISTGLVVIYVGIGMLAIVHWLYS